MLIHNYEINVDFLSHDCDFLSKIMAFYVLI